ncbi:MAG: trypsin-like peptidase domain-containing protein [Mitsuaria chitosanitabida]|uniref:S1 family peptidase n=1 Tax=Roseateles chitosanitabidus TaxID=65048 RepID=UPI001B2DA4B5|nr:serine protease [Roseateles chitosanitabidus]MBO9685708.1 trypsin-like peptidase domain-containing protein [Roseateles chitosanitabidus]
MTRPSLRPPSARLVAGPIRPTDPSTLTGGTDAGEGGRLSLVAREASAEVDSRRRGVLALGGVGLLGAAGATGLVGGLGALWSAPARAQEMSSTLPDLIDRSRGAVVAVGTFDATDSPRFGFRGTGFAVGDGRQIVTCAHVVPNPLEKELMITVPASANPTGQPQLRPVKLVRRDVPHDLAVLELTDGKPLTEVLSLATPEDRQPAVREGAAVALMGYPIGTQLGVTMATHRGIVAAITVTAMPAPTSNSLDQRALRQLRDGPMEFLQLDITAYPGNSGGPLLDIRTGKVVGVVNMVVLKGTRESALTAPSGISYAVPVKYVTAVLGK